MTYVDLVQKNFLINRLITAYCITFPADIRVYGFLLSLWQYWDENIMFDNMQPSAYNYMQMVAYFRGGLIYEAAKCGNEHI